MKLVKVQDSPGLVRDLNSNGIVNIDHAAYSSHKKKISDIKRKEDLEKDQKERINRIEQDVSELKNGINKILDILNNASN
jgi:hypothetical protein